MSGLGVPLAGIIVSVFSKNFLPSSRSLISCKSSIMMEVPLRHVFGLGAFIGLDGLLLSSEFCLSLLSGIW